MKKKIIYLFLVSILCLGSVSTLSWAKYDGPVRVEPFGSGEGTVIKDDWLMGCAWDAKAKRCYCKTSKGKKMSAPKSMCPDAPRSSGKFGGMQM